MKLATMHRRLCGIIIWPTEDYYALLQIVEAEATGGDMKSKILIANVVLNRVKDSRFPDTIYEVVWEKDGGVATVSAHC